MTTEQAVHDAFVQSITEAIRNDPPEEVAERIIDTMMGSLATMRSVETLPVILELAEEKQRRAQVESYLAYLIDRNDGRIEIDIETYDAWVSSHPDGGHVANVDGSTDTVHVLTVHHGSHDEDDDESVAFTGPIQPTSFVI